MFLTLVFKIFNIDLSRQKDWCTKSKEISLLVDRFREAIKNE